jgi:hypothetical protein
MSSGFAGCGVLKTGAAQDDGLDLPGRAGTAP